MNNIKAERNANKLFWKCKLDWASTHDMLQKQNIVNMAMYFQFLKYRALENCALLGYNASNSGNFLQTLRDNLSVPSWGLKNQKKFLLDSWNLKMGPIGCPETSVRNHHYSLRNKSDERSSLLLRGGNLKTDGTLLYQLHCRTYTSCSTKLLYASKLQIRQEETWIRQRVDEKEK